MNSRKKRVTLICIAVLVLAALMGLFLLLNKVKGEVSYVQNYFLKTRGSLPVVRYEAEEGDLASKEAEPYATKSTEPGTHLLGSALQVNGAVTDSYVREHEICITKEELSSFPGCEAMLTYRGNYKRDMTSVGTLTGAGTSLKPLWKYQTGRFLKNDGVNYWSGNGWTGQPAVVTWSDKWKKYMNLYPEAKVKEGLREVIYPGMDAKIHFLDLETGKESRDAINVGMIFKGTCSVHPDYPLLVCGSGDSTGGLFGETVCARIFIFSLIDGSKLYEFAYNDDFATRVWHGFDSSPIFASDADTLIYPGENGVLYTVHLNTEFDELSGVLSVSPDETVKYTYHSKASDERFEASENSPGSGSESSAVIWKNYLFFGDNGGVFQCLDLTTMKPVWVQDLLEDINSSPVLEFGEDGGAYIYVGTTLKYHFDKRHIGEACVYKLNAVNGEIIWKKPYEVHTVIGLAGGILSSGASGQENVADYIFYAVSKSPKVNSGYIVALSKTTGEEYWRMDIDCDAWSSGCLVYNEKSEARLVQCCANGDILLIDAISGKLLSSENFGANIESTPAIVDGRIVVGVRNGYIVGVEIE